MPAPTALLKQDPTPQPADIPVPSDPTTTEEMILDAPSDDIVASALAAAQSENTDITESMVITEESRPLFPAAKDTETATRRESRKIGVPPHRMSALKGSWSQIYSPLVGNLKLQVRMNVKAKAVEVRTSSHTTEVGALQKAEDFIRAFCLGFDVADAVAILRLDDIYVQTFEVKDVKTLDGDHLARAIGRICGKDGKTKFAIENTTRTRVAVAGSKISILGGFEEVTMARETVVSLILGKPPGKVYGNLRTISSRMKERR